LIGHGFLVQKHTFPMRISSGNLHIPALIHVTSYLYYMQRNTFLWSLISLFPLRALARNGWLANGRKGFKVPAGEGRYHGHMRLQGVNANILDLKISGKDNGGGFALFEQTSLSPGRGTPMHVHPIQDELFYIVEGQYFFKVGTDKFSLSAGDSIFLPRNVPHGWTQVSEKGKMTVMFQPAGKMEEFFVAVSGLQHPPTPAEMARLFEASDMKIVGPVVVPE
jgi:quercetin dioxygenase-like cupin family protein